MKKFVSGIIVGVLLFAGVTAFADSSSLIGQKVQGLFSIEKGGTKVADAVIINGSAYAPVRAVAEAVGTNLTVEGKKIIMSETDPISSPTAVQTDEERLEALELKADLVAKEIEKVKATIKYYEEKVFPRDEKAINGASTEGSKQVEIQRAEESKVAYEKYKQQLADLEASLVEINAQITALQK